MIVTLRARRSWGWAKVIPASAKSLANGLAGTLTIFRAAPSERSRHRLSWARWRSACRRTAIAQDAPRCRGGIAGRRRTAMGRLATTAEHVRAELGSEVESFSTVAACEVGIESTIVEVSAPGGAAASGDHRGRARRGSGHDLADAMPSSTRARGRSRSIRPQTRHVTEADLISSSREHVAPGERVACRAVGAQPLCPGLRGSLPSRPAATRAFLANLRALDRAVCSAMLVEQPATRASGSGARRLRALPRARHSTKLARPPSAQHGR